MFKLKPNLLLFLSGFVLTVGVVFAVSRIMNKTVPSNPRPFLKEGYDFQQKRAFNEENPDLQLNWQIRVSDLETTKGEKLSSRTSGNLILLAIIDPVCGACESSKDMMKELRSNASQLGIEYLPIVLESLSAETLQHYAETMGFDTCIWWRADLSIPAGLRRMGAPVHVLLTKEGLILQTWTGTSMDPEARMRMAKQISSDLLLIDHIVKIIKSA